MRGASRRARRSPRSAVAARAGAPAGVGTEGGRALLAPRSRARCPPAHGEAEAPKDPAGAAQWGSGHAGGLKMLTDPSEVRTAAADVKPIGRASRPSSSDVRPHQCTTHSALSIIEATRLEARDTHELNVAADSGESSLSTQRLRRHTVLPLLRDSHASWSPQ